MDIVLRSSRGFVRSAAITVALALTVSALSLESQEASAGSLFSPVVIGTGHAPSCVAIGDFNGDSAPDMAVTNLGSTVTVALGAVDGQFQVVSNFPSGSGPRYVAVADFNGDARMDLAVANGDGNSVSIFLGNGHGSFTLGPGGNFATGPNPQSLAVGDVNGDGRQDIVTGNRDGFPATVTVWLGNGDGTVSMRRDFFTHFDTAGIALADLNLDGRLDIVTANFVVNSYSVLLGNGDGTFGEASNHSAGASGPFSVAIADLNRDGKPDLALTDAGDGITGPTNQVSVYLGNGDGTFALGTGYPTGAQPLSVGIADFDGDGTSDLVVANESSGSLSVLLGNGDGTFKPRTDSPFFGTPHRLSVGDLDQDGRMDVAVVDINRDRANVLFGNGNGKLGGEIVFNPGPGPAAIAAGDLNQDGRQDLATANTGNHSITISVGSGDGTFQPIFAIDAGMGLNSIAIGDLNADGRRDIAATNSDENTVSVFLGNGDGTLGSRKDFKTGSVPRSVAIADLNGDRKPDLAVTDQGTAKVSVLSGNGMGNFGARSDYQVAQSPGAVVVGDLNADGRPDLVVLGMAQASANGLVSVLLAKRNGTFDGKVDYQVGVQSPDDMAIGDLNGDGRLDLAIASHVTGGVRVLLGNGNGTFGAPGPVYGPFSPSSVVIADLTGDGKPDLALSSFDNPFGIFVLIGSGDGAFAVARQGFAAESTPRDIVVADLNGDGRPDLATPNFESSSVSVYLNRSAGVQAIPQATASASRLVPQNAHLNVAVAPNPFNPEAAITFRTQLPGPVRIRLYDLNGRLVRTLLDQPAEAGEHRVHIDGRDNSGRRLASGTYFYRIETREGAATGRLSILK